MLQSILNTPTHDQIKLEVLRQHFPQAIETDADGRIHINASALQLAIDPSNPAGVQVEEDGFELRWVDKGVQIRCETKINGESLAQLISGMQ